MAVKEHLGTGCEEWDQGLLFCDQIRFSTNFRGPEANLICAPLRNMYLTRETRGGQASQLVV